MNEENKYHYTPLPEPIPITEQKWPDDVLPLVCTRTMTYMHEKFIRECIDGILMQKTTFPVRVLIHEDASTDKTADIVREYERKYPQLIKAYYQTENSYSKPDKYERRSTFIKWRIGKYEAPCEGDDYWTDPLKLQKQVDFLEAHPEYALTFCNVSVVYDGDVCDSHPGYSDDPKMSECGFRQIRTPEKNTTIEDLAKGNYIHTPGVLVRRDAIDTRNHFCDFMLNCPTGDWALHMHAALHGSIRYMPEVMAVYRVHAGGLWSGQSVKKRLGTAVSIFYWAAHCDMFPRSYRDMWLDKSVCFYLELIKETASVSKIELPSIILGDTLWHERMGVVLLQKDEEHKVEMESMMARMHAMQDAYEKSSSLRVGRKVLRPFKSISKLLGRTR